MWFGEEYFQYVSKELLKSFKDCYENKQLSENSFRITLNAEKIIIGGIMTKQLTISEKWELDADSYKMDESTLTAIPICENCRYYLKGNVFHCEKYTEEEKPNDVVFPSKECPKFCAKHQIDLNIKTDYEQKLHGGIWGFILADAMGVPVEFTSRRERDKDPVKEIRAYGTYHQPYGSWSDDTSLMLCLMQNIVEGYSIDNLARLFIKYLKEGYMTPYGRIFDIGSATKRAIINMEKGMEPILCGGVDEQDNGNGSLMRILPLAYYLRNEIPEKSIELIQEISSLTHRHKRSVLACIIYVEMAIQLIKGESKQSAYSKTIRFIEDNCTNVFYNEFIYFNKILTGEIDKLKREKIKSSGYVVDTLEAAFWSFMTTSDYKEAILTAINLGEDTDTVGAITGGLAGLFYGYDNIPITWLQYLPRRDELLEHINEFGLAVSM